MNKLMIACAAGTMLAASAATASEPLTLSDTQLDSVAGGFLFAAGGGVSFKNTSFGSRTARAQTDVGGGFLETTTTNFDTRGNVTSVVVQTEASGFANSRASATSRGFYTIATNGLSAAGGIFVFDN